MIPEQPGDGMAWPLPSMEWTRFKDNRFFNICYNAHRIEVPDGLRHPVKRETGEIPVLPPQR